jgi:hypothetical protein
MLPRSVFEALSSEGQRVAANLASKTEEVTATWAPDWLERYPEGMRGRLGALSEEELLEVGAHGGQAIDRDHPFAKI